MSNNKLFIVFILLLSFIFTSCELDERCIKADGSIVGKTLSLPSFSGVDIRLAGNVEIIKSNTYKIEIQARENIADLIRTDIIGGTLRIDMDNQCVRGKSDMSFKVYTSELSNIRLAGSGNINSQDVFPQQNWKLQIDGSGDVHARINADHAEAVISGSGELFLKGATNTLRSNISGSGNIHAFEVSTKELDATISGSGNTEATVTEVLRGTISGSGNIRYKGQAVVNHIVTSGSGKLIKVN